MPDSIETQCNTMALALVYASRPYLAIEHHIAGNVSSAMYNYDRNAVFFTLIRLAREETQHIDHLRVRFLMRQVLCCPHGAMQLLHAMQVRLQHVSLLGHLTLIKILRKCLFEQMTLPQVKHYCSITAPYFSSVARQLKSEIQVELTAKLSLLPQELAILAAPKNRAHICQRISELRPFDLYILSKHRPFPILPTYSQSEMGAWVLYFTVKRYKVKTWENSTKKESKWVTRLSRPLTQLPEVLKPYVNTDKECRLHATAHPMIARFIRHHGGILSTPTPLHCARFSTLFSGFTRGALPPRSVPKEIEQAVCYYLNGHTHS